MMPTLDTMQQCAPTVAPSTVRAVIQVESGGNPYAVNVNGFSGIRPNPASAQEALLVAQYYISRGYTVDLGLMQINSRNVQRLGMPLKTMFDPCTNLRVGSELLTRNYLGAVKQYGPGQPALRAALSAYNSGNFSQGMKNGYVAKYYPGSGKSITLSLRATAPARASILAEGTNHPFTNRNARSANRPALPPDPLADY